MLVGYESQQLQKNYLEKVESDDAINFEDFTQDNEAEADTHVIDCFAVTNEILNQDDDDAKLLDKLKIC